MHADAQTPIRQGRMPCALAGQSVRNPLSRGIVLVELVARVQVDPSLWASTASVITTDEGGGFDSGTIRNRDLFGDGPHIPLVVVSPFARRGYVDPTYEDHASILKFIERNWRLPALSLRSRDRLPNPRMPDEQPYRPLNSPAIGDLMSLFDFRPGQRRADVDHAN